MALSGGIDPAGQTDLLGHALLRDRQRRIPSLLSGMLEEKFDPILPDQGPSRFVVTGTGSSGAHGRYLCWLLNRYTPHAAEFRDLSAFLREDEPENAVLVVISQGISPNATFPLSRMKQFSHLVVFTSASVDGLRRHGKEEPAQLLERLERAGAYLLRFPLEEEFTTLLRVAGPMAGYLACARFATALRGSHIPPPPPNLPDLIAGAAEMLPDELRQISVDDLAGCQLVATHPITGFAHNLSYKFLEGLFLPAPVVSDVFQYAHGPFQQNFLRRGPVLHLVDDSPACAELEERLATLNAAAGSATWVLRTTLPEPYQIFQFEALLNELVLSLMERCGIDQINWPGKNRDTALYSYSVPFG